MRISIFFLTILFAFCLSNNIYSQQKKPNILLITLDDMNWDSAGAYGNKIPDITPNIDAIAKQGVLFENAYVQAPNCSPSRVVIQTGLYPHQSGMRGFYYVKDNIQTLPEVLKENGYTTGVINKVSDTSLSPDFKTYWDVTKNISGTKKRSATIYGEMFNQFLKKDINGNSPFYCVINIADPHKPFFNDSSSKKKGFDKFPPSKVYNLNDVQIPAFLPQNKEIKQEVLNYYNSVKRGDDCVGAIMTVLKRSKSFENTIVILLSDHGMPFPFAKSTVYQNGLKTPLLISWSKKYPTKVDKFSMVSSVDLAPTILDMAHAKVPKKMVGKSFLDAIEKNKKIGTVVFGQFDENAGGIPRPSRTIITKRYGYVFNPWATGKFVFQSAATWHKTYKVMKKMANFDNNVKERFNFWKYRTIEEFYDYEKDPDALTNLINHPDYQEVIKSLRTQLIHQMKATDDYVLTAINQRGNKVFLNDWMDNQVIEAKKRRETIQWKRGSNASGSTKKNSKLFQNNLENK